MESKSRQIIKFQAALLELARCDLSRFEDAISKILAVDAKTLGVGRVSIWFFDSTRTEIVCESLYRLEDGGYEKGLRLQARRYPAYFRALEESRTIAADDAVADARTAEFAPDYLKPLGITSMLDVPIRRGGLVVGILCHEHTAAKRSWKPDEQEFAASIADLVALALEVSERAKAQEELARSNRELKQFASIVAHDIQEPLRTIEAFAERLAKMMEDRLGEKEVDYLSRIRSAARRMSRFTGDLLLYSKVTTKERTTEIVDLNEILREVRQDLEPAIQDGGIQIEVSPLPSIRADRMQMRQLFLNLLSNAVKFTQKVPKPRVVVRSHVGDGGTFEVSVADNGIGFDPAYAERIFEPFERLHDREDYPGSGMGLAVCRCIVERHNGTITAEGEVGEGATFRVALPG